MTPNNFQHGWNLANSATAEKAAHMQRLINKVEALKAEIVVLNQQIDSAKQDNDAHNAFVLAFREAAIKAGVDPRLLQVV